MKDLLTGKDYWASMAGNDNTTKSHNIDIFGNYLLNNGWNFKFSTRMHFAKVAISTIIPLSIFQPSESAGYTIASTGQPYSGYIG
ncbi:hypothetical protein, partial [Burkholderia sp. SIMBA_062]